MGSVPFLHHEHSVRSVSLMRLDLAPESRRDADLLFWPGRPRLSYATLCIIVGASAFIISLVATAVASQMSGVGVESFSRANDQPRSLLDAVLGFVIYPSMIETAVLFLAPLAVLNRAVRPPMAMSAISAVLMVAVGWLLHGASLEALGPALSFGLLGFVGGCLYRSKGMEVTFLVVSFSHAIWNGLIVLVWLLR